MKFPVIKGASYNLYHAPTMTMYQGTTQTSELKINKDSDHLIKLESALRSFDEVVKYPPNQVYIGNVSPELLMCHKKPWYSHPVPSPSREGKFGDIYSEDELIGLVKIVDVFELVILEESFALSCKAKLSVREELGIIEERLNNFEKGAVSHDEISKMVKAGGEGIFHAGRLVGVVKKAHEFDESLSAHVMYENLVSKATSVGNVLQLFSKSDLRADDVDYIIECSEEACGDMNQRGGGNIAKSIGEICKCNNATGSDIRSFCAGPAHAMVMASALVKSGVYKNVLVVAGGSTAKLGMNSKSHIEKSMPILEDVLGSFAVLVSEDDGVSPIIRTDAVGRHKIGSGSAPQSVMTAIVTDPLDSIGLKIKDIDKFSPEMQNPEITVPAGAGDVPLSNFKMIAALGVKKGEFQRDEIEKIVQEKGLPGYAPTQGHIPSGIPFIGFARERMIKGDLKRVMIIGKGSLFLGRLTNQFDGVSFIMEKNDGNNEAEVQISKEEIRSVVADALRKLSDNL